MAPTRPLSCCAPAVAGTDALRDRLVLLMVPCCHGACASVLFAGARRSAADPERTCGACKLPERLLHVVSAVALPFRLVLGNSCCAGGCASAVRLALNMSVTAWKEAGSRRPFDGTLAGGGRSDGTAGSGGRCCRDAGLALGAAALLTAEALRGTASAAPDSRDA